MTTPPPGYKEMELFGEQVVVRDEPPLPIDEENVIVTIGDRVCLCHESLPKRRTEQMQALRELFRTTEPDGAQRS